MIIDLMKILYGGISQPPYKQELVMKGQTRSSSKRHHRDPHPSLFQWPFAKRRRHSSNVSYKTRTNVSYSTQDINTITIGRNRFQVPSYWSIILECFNHHDGAWRKLPSVGVEWEELLPNQLSGIFIPVFQSV